MASITPYFRQASMKSAARSKYLMLSQLRLMDGWEKEVERQESEKERKRGGWGRDIRERCASSQLSCLCF